MSVRESSAWITLLTVAICFGVYFGAILTGAVSSRGMDTAQLFLVCVTALVILQVGLNIFAAVASPRDARAPQDEREKLIRSRSHTVGYYTLMMLVLALAIPGHLGYNVIDLMHFALFGVVLATLVVSATQIVLLRRGA